MCSSDLFARSDHCPMSEVATAVRRLPLVALVGRPNVGKSTLFNRIVGSRRAVVEDRAGTTRDRLIAEAEWSGERFRIVDTGGVQPAGGSAIDIAVQDQARIAVTSADLIILVVDAASGPNPADAEVAQLIRRSGKPIIVAANKADTLARERGSYEFAQLGFEEILPVSAQHGIGSGELLDAILARLHELPPVDEALPPSDEVTVAIVGRPNVGKSSLLNQLVGEERTVVSDVPGTTRDAIDEEVDHAGRRIVLVDTAGIRRRGKVAAGPAAEKWATVRSVQSLERADVALQARVVLDHADDALLGSELLRIEAFLEGRRGALHDGGRQIAEPLLPRHDAVEPPAVAAAGGIEIGRAHV